MLEPIIQTGFYPSTNDVKSMMAEHPQQCDTVICLSGPALWLRVGAARRSRARIEAGHRGHQVRSLCPRSEATLPTK